MILRSRDGIEPVDWGNGTSHRFLVASDPMGFTVCHTVVRAGTKARLEYRRHLEACYCISGSGWVVEVETGAEHRISTGVMYALDKHDPHFLIADAEGDMELISIFNPPLQGHERHNLDGDEFSQY